MISAFSDLLTPFTGMLSIGMASAAVVLGLVSLFFGRRLYWLFVGVVGFLFGLLIAPELLSGLDGFWQILVSVLIGLLFSILSIVLNKFMIALAGAIGFGVLAFSLAQDYVSQPFTWAITVLAGVIGLLVAWFVFDWGLILFSSMAGSFLVVSGLLTFLPDLVRFDLIGFSILLVLGLVFQAVDWSRENQQKEENGVVKKEEVIVVDD